MTRHGGIAIAVVNPDFESLAQILCRIKAAGITSRSRADHGVSKALYLCDPTAYGVAVYVDTSMDV